jgi:hypothetical protein
LEATRSSTLLAGAIASQDQLTDISTLRWLLTGAEIVCVAGKARPKGGIHVHGLVAAKRSVGSVTRYPKAAAQRGYGLQPPGGAASGIIAPPVWPNGGIAVST